MITDQDKSEAEAEALRQIGQHNAGHPIFQPETLGRVVLSQQGPTISHAKMCDEIARLRQENEDLKSEIAYFKSALNSISNKALLSLAKEAK